MQKNDNYYFEVFRPRIFVILSNFLYEIVQVLYSKQTCTRCPFCVDNVFCFKKVFYTRGDFLRKSPTYPLYVMCKHKLLSFSSSRSLTQIFFQVQQHSNSSFFHENKSWHGYRRIRAALHNKETHLNNKSS